jgi:hypothetical protein
LLNGGSGEIPEPTVKSGWEKEKSRFKMGKNPDFKL